MRQFVFFWFLFFVVIQQLFSQGEMVKRRNEVELKFDDSICFFYGQPYSGEVIDFTGPRFDKTKMTFDAHYAEGNRNGAYTKWFPGHVPQCNENYSKGSRDGIQRYYYPNGKLKEERNYIFGAANGGWTEWYENQKVKYSVAYSLGKVRDGVYVSYSDKGEKEAEWTYSGGSLIRVANNQNGQMVVTQETSIDRYPDGSKKSEGMMIAEKRTGTWKNYYPSGKLQTEENYKDGLLSGLWKSFYENGREDSSGSYSEGRKTGDWSASFPNGKPKFQGAYFFGYKEGKWLSWFENGQKEIDGTFVHGKMEGKGFKRFAENDMWYDGDWKNDAFNGYGTYSNDKNYTYTGYFADGKYSGQGTVTRKDGVMTLTYKGEFREGNLYNGVCRGVNEKIRQVTENTVVNGKYGPLRIVN